VLKRLGKRLRPAGPATLVLVRGDRHCASPEVRQWSEEHPALSSVTGWPRNAVFQEGAREGVEQANGA
jgi:hypothetical protein